MATRQRINGQWYELARFYAPVKEAEYILSKRQELKKCEGHKVYDEIRQEERLVYTYEQQYSWQYLRELFFVLSTKTPVYVTRVRPVREVTVKPTNELEREVFGMKEQPCTLLSIKVRINDYQRTQVEQMISIVEQKMKSFQTDFYLHDMKVFARELGKHPIMWIVGTSHTFMEVHDSDYDAQWYATTEKAEYRNEFLSGKDNTWIGSALRVACYDSDLFYYHDGSVLHKVSREKFTEIHNRYLEHVRGLVREKLEQKAA